MPEHEWRFYVEDMISFAEYVLAFIEGFDLASFESTRMNY